MRYLILFIFLYFSFCAIAQSSDLYDILLKRGIEEQKKGNYTEAIQKWQVALDKLSNLSAEKRKKLTLLISEANRAATKKSRTIASKLPVRVIHDTIFKTILQHDTTEREIIHLDTIVKERTVERIVIQRDTIIQRDTVVSIQNVYVDKPVYIDKPEPYHPYGKGKGRLMIYNLCGVGNWKIYLDGNYLGILYDYFPRKLTKCAEYSRGVLYKYAISGMHHISASNGITVWDIHVQLYEDYCQPVEIPACK